MVQYYPDLLLPPDPGIADRRCEQQHIPKLAVRHVFATQAQKMRRTIEAIVANFSVT